RDAHRIRGARSRADPTRASRARRGTPRLVPDPRTETARGAARRLRRRMSSSTAPFAFDPFAVHADPYPTYRRLRHEVPVHYSEERRIWSVSRYDDVMHVLKSPEIFSSRAMFKLLMAGGTERIQITWRTIPFIWNLIWKLRMNPLEFHLARNLIAEDGERHS